MAVCKNYKADGGDTLVIGGKLKLLDGAVIEGALMENQPSCTATTVAATVAELNSLLTKLKATGLMAPDEA